MVLYTDYESIKHQTKSSLDYLQENIVQFNEVLMNLNYISGR